MRLFSSRRADPDHLTLEIAGDAVRVDIRRNPRARRYTLRLPAAGGAPVLTIPARGTFAAARDFARRHSDWLAAQMARVPAAQPFVAGASVPLRGVAHLIDHRPAARGTVRLTAEADGPRLVVSGEGPHLARRLTDYLKREARRDLTAAVARHADALGKRPTAMSIRDTRTRWGSCTSAGRLSFSWRLILAPPQILDYVAAHEVAHLAEMNHSDRFWAVTRELYPDTDEARAWLRQHGMTLHSYG